jgi:hypothetical protein
MQYPTELHNSWSLISWAYPPTPSPLACRKRRQADDEVIEIAALEPPGAEHRAENGRSPSAWSSL